MIRCRFFQSFNTLQSTYRQALCKLYDKDIRKFFENARFKISGNKFLTQTAGSSQVKNQLLKLDSKKCHVLQQFMV